MWYGLFLFLTMQFSTIVNFCFHHESCEVINPEILLLILN